MMFVVVIVLSVINTLLMFPTLAAAARSNSSQRKLRHVLVDGFNQMVDRTDELTEIIESSMDCLVSVDAKAAESSPTEEHAR
jgi:hypothetical protein